MRLITNWTACHTIQGVIVFVISNRPHAAHSSDFEITYTNYALNCTPLGPVTTTYGEQGWHSGESARLPPVSRVRFPDPASYVG